MDNIIIYKEAKTHSDFEEAKHLFKEYFNSLGISLSFQDFEKELMVINVQYNKPEGGQLLAQINQIFVGCVGINTFNKSYGGEGFKVSPEVLVFRRKVVSEYVISN